MRLNTVRTRQRPARYSGVRITYGYLADLHRFRTRSNAVLEKASCVYLNSSIGIFSHLLGNRTNKIPSYPHFSLDDLRNLTVPDFPSLGDAALTHLAAAYDAHAADVLLPLPQMNECSTRQALDQAVCTALDPGPRNRRHHPPPPRRRAIGDGQAVCPLTGSETARCLPLAES